MLVSWLRHWVWECVPSSKLTELHTLKMCPWELSEVDLKKKTKSKPKEQGAKTSLVVQWWSLHGPTAEAWVRSPGRSAGKESSCNAGDPGSIPGLGTFPGEGIGYSLQHSWGSLMAQTVKNLPAMQKNWVQSLGWEDTLEEAWQPSPVFFPGESSWTEEPGGLQSMALQSQTQLGIALCQARSRMPWGTAKKIQHTKTENARWR